MITDALIRDGFVVLDGLLDAAEVGRARVAVDEAIVAPSGMSCERPNNTLVPLRWDSAAVSILLDDGARRARIGAAAAARDLRWISGYVSSKDPHSPPLWWHQDWWCWDHPRSFEMAAPQVALLCYLGTTTAQTGALRVLPGSHRRSLDLHAALPEAHALDASELDPGHPAMRDHPGQVTLAMQPGDAVLTDYRLLHGTHTNEAPLRRDCLLLTFTPDWSALPDDIRAHLISHPALPGDDERPDRLPWTSELLPMYTGARRDLPLNRNAPASFRIGADVDISARAEPVRA